MARGVYAQPCPVSANPHWSTQEKFVWERVCIGKIADFNHALGYDGYLDPKQQKGWPENRVLRLAFLQMILFKKPYRQALTRHGVVISGARFTETIDLNSEKLETPLALLNSRLDKGVNLARVKDNSWIWFSGSSVSGTLNMYSLALSADLIMQNGEFADVNLSDAHIGRVALSGSKVRGKLDMSGLQVVSDLLMLSGAEFADVELGRARVGGLISLSGSKVSGRLRMSGVQVGEDLRMRNKAEFASVELIGARIGGDLDLESSKVRGPLIMNRLHIGGALLMRNAEFSSMDLGGARIGSDLSLIGSEVRGKLNMNGLQVDRNLLMRNKAKFAEVELAGARIGGDLSLIGSEVRGKLNMNALHVEGTLFMRGGTMFDGVELTAARVGGILDLGNSKVTGGKLKMTQVHVGQLLLGNNAQFGSAELQGAYVGGDLNLSGSKVSHALDMYGVQVGRDLIMDEATFADVTLVSAQVGGILKLNKSKVSGTLSMQGLHVKLYLLSSHADLASVELGDARVGGILSLINSKVSGQLQMTALRVDELILNDLDVEGDFECYGLEIGRQAVIIGAKFDGQINCRDVKIKSDLNLKESQFHKNVNLSGAEIDGALILDAAVWSDNANLILRDAKVGGIPTLMDGWARRLDLSGFTYRSAGAADNFKHWLGGLARYEPQPYSQLASIVQDQGNSTLATAIRYSGRERERSEATGGRWIWLTVLKLVIGYGYYPERSIVWAIVLVIAGAVVLRVSGEGPRNGMPFGLTYSFDMLLPVIRLREKNQEIDLHGWTRYYFYGQKIMGYVLVFFLVATFSGLTR